MRKIICDRCGAEILPGERIGYLALNWRSRSDDSLMIENPYEAMDFCPKCMRDIAAVIDFKVVSVPEEEEEAEEEEDEVLERIEQTPAPDPVEEVPEVVEEEPAEQPQVPEEPAEPKKRKHVDLKVLRELVKADKTAKEIADYFGITLKQYYYQRKRAEQLYIEGRL